MKVNLSNNPIVVDMVGNEKISVPNLTEESNDTLCNILSA
jgi:hypothetical protein